MGLLQTRAVDYTQLEQLIGKDLVLAGRLMAVANSPFYGFSGRISSISQACLMLGLPTTSNIVMAAAVMVNLSPQPSSQLDHAGIWDHSNRVASCAAEISRHIDLNDKEALTAGLLHDIGKLVLDSHFGPAYQDVISAAEVSNRDWYEIEREQLGIDHAEVGGMVAEHWHLPPLISSVLSAHHSPEKVGESPLALLIYLADRLVHAHDKGGDEGAPPPIYSKVLKRLNIDPATIQSVSRFVANTVTR